MCTVSMVGDHYRDIWKDRHPWMPTAPSGLPIVIPPQVTKDEFEALKREVEDLKALLKRAKKYDEDNGEPDCEMDDKVALLKKVADLVGVDLSEVFGGQP